MTYYDHTNYPQQGAYGSSEAMRAELETIEAAFAQVDTDKAGATDLAALEARVTAIELYGGGGGGGNTGNAQPLSVLLTSIANLTVSADKMLYAVSDSAFATTPLTAYARALLDDADGVSMRSTLGLVIGQHVQAYSDRVNSFANAAGVVANTMPYFTATNTVASTPLSAFARTLLDDPDATTMKETLGITDSLAANAALNAIASTTPAADRLAYFNGTTTAALAVFSAFGRSLVGSDNSATGRAVLGLGSMATQNTTGWATESYVGSVLSGYVSNGSLSSTLSNYVTNGGLTSALSGYATTGHTHTQYAATSHTHSQYAANGTNSDITNLTGLNTVQNWSNVRGMEIGTGIQSANSSNYFGVVNPSPTNSNAYLFARCRKSDNTGDYQLSLLQNNTGTGLVETTGNLLIFKTDSVGSNNNPLALEGVTVEFPENAASSVGGLTRYYGSGRSIATRVDVYVSKSTTPTFNINNASGVGVQLAWNANSWTPLSDMRFKNRVAEIESPLAVMAKITPFLGTYKSDTESRIRAFYSAQEVLAAGWGNAVYQNDDGDLSLSYESMTPLVHAGVNELATLHSATQLELAALKKEVMALKAQVALLS